MLCGDIHGLRGLTLFAGREVFQRLCRDLEVLLQLCQVRAGQSSLLGDFGDLAFDLSEESGITAKSLQRGLITSDKPFRCRS